MRSLHAGGSPISPLVARKLLLRAQAAAPPAPTEPEAPSQPLSTREHEVLRLVARGHTLVEVAQVMGVSQHTTRSYVRRIYDKLQVGSRAEAVNKAMRQGLLGGK